MPSSQFENKDLIVFSEFDGMNTQAARHDLEEKEAAWMENLQPIGKNNIINIPAIASALHTLTGETVTRQFYFNFGQSTDYVINFCASGAAYAVANPGGATTTIATAGTFSSSPDVTQWGTQRILIADATAGYSTWDTHAFVQYGGVSPNILITNGGTGYTSPIVTITTGGSGTGAAATATQTGGVITAITLTAAGTGYVTGDTVTIAITDGGPGASATATGHVWPNLTPKPTTLAVFQGRVFMAQTNVVTYTGTGGTTGGVNYGGVGYDDFRAGTASGSTTIQDPDLVRVITALRSLNNYLFIIGDNSVKQIGNLSVSGSTTNFTIVTLSSDQGTTFRDTVLSYNRLVVFANTVGVYAVFGASVEKISDKMDGVFRLIDFSQNPCSAVNDINNIHCYMLLVRYEDPVAGTRSIILSFMNKKWFVISQGNSLKYITTAIVNGVTETFSSAGSDVTRLLADPNTAVSITLSTALTSHGTPYLGKSSTRYAVAQKVGGTSALSLKVESERSPSQSFPYSASVLLVFTNNSGGVLQFQNNTMLNLNFSSQTATFLYQTGNTGGVAGVYLGATLTGTVTSFALNTIVVEYRPGTAFGSAQQSFGAS